ncbi:HAD hydrolase family protein, partial [Phocaeicola sp. HCN-40430]|uniref:HAD hydrolase family protein n=1 Tax=Phocaeicola sp. HCN-40430 TaxID=3134664 RepID=UPI0030BA9C91
LKTGIITSENTKIVENRAKKLKLDFLIQGKKNGGKLAAAQEICQQLGITLEEVAYIGDDINCQELLEAVGYAGCPADAHEKIKDIHTINIMKLKGGDGCVREFINNIINY